MKEIKKRSGCPVSFSLDFIGDKWTLLILRDIVLYDKSTYGEFFASEEGMASSILANRLNMLESYGFLNKRVGTDKKSKFVYSMTEKGIALVPMIMELTLWGSRFNPPGDPDLLKKLEQDKTGTITKYQEKLRKSMLKAVTPN